MFDYIIFNKIFNSEAKKEAEKFRNKKRKEMEEKVEKGKKGKKLSDVEKGILEKWNLMEIILEKIERELPLNYKEKKFVNNIQKKEGGNLNEGIY